jgi:lysophospholipase L1-like esterase
MTSALISRNGSITIVASFDTLQHYDFNCIRVFCNATSAPEFPEVHPKELVQNTWVDPAGEYVQYNLKGYTDTLSLTMQQQDTLRPFQLYGISLENDDPGVIYNTIGVNGAMLTSYLKCGHFNRQLNALDPDWVILSIGTNEGNTRSFDADSYRTEYVRLIDSVRTAAPGAAILLTVPNDSYLHKRYMNPNTARMREIIFTVAGIKGCGVWDFYTIMGGLNSARSWYDNGLMSKDHIHFNKPGYILKGDLFFNAFLNSWNDPSFTRLYTIPAPAHPVSSLPAGETGIRYPVSSLP